MYETVEIESGTDNLTFLNDGLKVTIIVHLLCIIDWLVLLTTYSTENVFSDVLGRGEVWTSVIYTEGKKTSCYQLK